MSKNHKLKYNLFTCLLFLVFSNVVAQNLYKTPSGKKYHLSSCRMVENFSKKLTNEDITNYGLTACKICKPSTVKNTTNRSSLYNTNKAVGTSNTTQCNGRTKKGSRCKHKTSLANGYCYQHTSQNSTSDSFKATSSTTAATCGARTKSGGFCKRKVKNNKNCYQHK